MRLLLFIVLLIGCVIDSYATNRALLIGIGKYPTILKKSIIYQWFVKI